MNKERQRIAIAEACGTMRWSYALPEKCIGASVPDYLNDLNAMHEAVNVLTIDQLWRMNSELEKLCGVFGGHGSGNHEEWTWHATAAQRAEAFLKTLGRWEAGQ